MEARESHTWAHLAPPDCTHNYSFRRSGFLTPQSAKDPALGEKSVEVKYTPMPQQASKPGPSPIHKLRAQRFTPLILHEEPNSNKSARGSSASRCWSEPDPPTKQSPRFSDGCCDKSIVSHRSLCCSSTGQSEQKQTITV